MPPIDALKLAVERARCQEIIEEIQRAKRAQKMARALGAPPGLNVAIIAELRAELRKLQKKLLATSEKIEIIPHPRVKRRG
jgi:hypothetical protein